jgi:hypothetical protein
MPIVYGPTLRSRHLIVYIQRIVSATNFCALVDRQMSSQDNYLNFN